MFGRNNSRSVSSRHFPRKNKEPYKLNPGSLGFTSGGNPCFQRWKEKVWRRQWENRVKKWHNARDRKWKREKRSLLFANWVNHFSFLRIGKWSRQIAKTDDLPRKIEVDSVKRPKPGVTWVIASTAESAENVGDPQWVRDANCCHTQSLLLSTKSSWAVTHIAVFILLQLNLNAGNFLADPMQDLSVGASISAMRRQIWWVNIFVSEIKNKTIQFLKVYSGTSGFPFHQA